MEHLLKKDSQALAAAQIPLFGGGAALYPHLLRLDRPQHQVRMLALDRASIELRHALADLGEGRRHAHVFVVPVLLLTPESR